MKTRSIIRAFSLAIVAGSLLLPAISQAVPSFARQTGLDCATCHTVFPQLTPFGRLFKLNGYTMANGSFNTEAQHSEKLSEDAMAPLAAMLQADYSSMKNNDGTSPKDTVQFPQQFSIFYAGRISDYMGAFAQVTLDSSNTIAMDNADVRYARSTTISDGTPFIYGFSLNNSPTVEDITNSTSAWGFPFAGAEADNINAPGYGTQLGTGAFAQTTGGVVAYAMIDNSWYGAAGLYHDTNINAGGGQGLDGWAPYARFTYQKDFGTINFNAGFYGMSGKTTSDVTDISVPTAKFSDVGIDGQFQYISGPHTATVRANYIQEKLTDATNIGYANNSVKIHDLNINGEYYYDRKIGAGLGAFATGGDADVLAYGDSISGKPDSSGVITEVNYLPWLNTKFSLQYTMYSKFDGGSSYISANTGLERRAKDNNTLYLAAWLMF